MDENEENSNISIRILLISIRVIIDSTRIMQLMQLKSFRCKNEEKINNKLNLRLKLILHW